MLNADSLLLPSRDTFQAETCSNQSDGAAREASIHCAPVLPGMHAMSSASNTHPDTGPARPRSDRCEVPSDQEARYANFYGRSTRLKRLFRFDVRYRCRRLRETLGALGIDLEGKRVLDYGFGAGDLLASFPRSCRIYGVDISKSAVAAARRDRRFDAFVSAEFRRVACDSPSQIPAGPYDLIVSAHTLEHVPDDRCVLQALRQRLAPSGVIALFVPVEEPDYIAFHVRNYSIQSFAERVERAGFELLHVEGSMYVNGHVWKLITIPSRRGWPVLGPLVDALRLGALSCLPYRALRLADAALYRLGLGARQVLVIARAREAREGE